MSVCSLCNSDECENQPVAVPADDDRDWKTIDDCEGCGIVDAVYRAIKMREGRRRKLCHGCFTHELERKTVSPTDPRVERDGYGGAFYA